MGWFSARAQAKAAETSSQIVNEKYMFFSSTLFTSEIATAMKVKSLIPFLITDALLAAAALLLFHVDFIINTTLYQYGLRFDTNWATPYWTTIRLGLALICITIILVPTIAYIILRHSAVQTSKTTVYVCKNCHTSWSTVKKITKINGQLPKPKILKTCPTCNEKLLDRLSNNARGRDGLEN